MVKSGDESATASGAPAAAPDPMAPIRSRGYVALLILAALLGAPLAAGAFGFLQAVSHLQTELFTDLPTSLGFHDEPTWWPLPLLAVAGFLVALAIRYLPGTGGHEPSEGLKTGGFAKPSELPGILLAALASIGLGAVIGPEAPLIALGGGLAALAARLAKRDADAKTIAVAAAAGSFAAVSALLGSPLLGAFLLMEASGLGGATLGIVLMPGLLAAGVGALMFVGLGSWTGLGTGSLSIANPPPASDPTVAEFGWALVIGVASAFLGVAIRRGALYLRRPVGGQRLVLTPLAGLGAAGLAIAFAEGTGKTSNEVLFSGQSALSQLIDDGARYSVGALILLFACKGVAYALSLAAFRGGPVFPAMFLGAAGGIALSHAPGLPLGPGVAMGIGAMGVAMLKLPMTSVLLATLLLGKSGLTVMPLVIVAVVVCHVIAIRLVPVIAESADPHPPDPTVPDSA
jgi:H+/Cl- antiporter ClcA